MKESHCEEPPVFSLGRHSQQGGRRELFERISLVIILIVKKMGRLIYNQSYPLLIISVKDKP